MICPQCKTANDDEYVFCVNCGTSIGPDSHATVSFDPRTSPQISRPDPLPETVFVKESVPMQTSPAYPSESTIIRQPAHKSRLPLIAGITVVLLAGLVAIIALGVYFISPGVIDQRAEIFPDHLGLFWRKDPNAALVEVKKLDYTNALDGRNALLKDETLQIVSNQPDLILYADAAEVSLGDLRFVKLDTLTDEGKVKYLDFQASLIDGKPAMKRIKFERPLESGRYAFALFSGFLTEGKHRFWPIEIRDSNAPAGQFTQELSLSIKPTGTPQANTNTNTNQAAQVVEIPAGATIAYCARTDVRLRRSASLSGKQLDKLAIKQKVYVIRYSENSDLWNGIESNWALVQTEKGKQGWVFNAFLDHGKN